MIAPHSSLFNSLYKAENLLTAWIKVRSNAGAAGADGITVGGFDRRAPYELARLGRELAEGTYTPGPLRTVSIPKTHGGMRRLSIPTVADRIVQTAAAQILGPVLDKEFEDGSYGYRPGRSVRMAVDRIAALRRDGYEWVVEGDIDDYFDSVPHDRLCKRLERYVGEPAILALIRQWLAAMGPGGKGIPQGSPISPLLANLYLDDVDEAIEGNGVRLVRYADDFVLLCKSERSANDALARVRALLTAEGLTLDPEKTRILGFDQALHFLGHVFMRTLALDERREINGTPIESDLHDAEAPLVVKNDSILRQADIAMPAGSSDRNKEPLEVRAGLHVLHILGKGRTLDVRNQAFSVCEGGNEILAVHHRRVDRVEIGPAADVTGGSLRLALGTDLVVAFTDGFGGTIGMLAPRLAPDAALHLAQARHTLDPSLRLDLARRIIVGRLRNQRALLGRRRRPLSKRPEAVSTMKFVEDAAQVIYRETLKVQRAKDVQAVMGHEGYATQRLWRALDALLKHDWHLPARERRPPPDPVNIVLSFLASILYRDIATYVLRHGLHPGFGALHTPRDNHDGCVSDLVEEFRAPLVEGLALYLFNSRTLDRQDFVEMETGRYHLMPDGARRVIHAYERATMRSVRSPRRHREISWRALMEEQVLAYRRHVTDEEPYKPYPMDF